MTSIKGRQIICEDEFLEMKITRWIKQAGGNVFEDISKIFRLLDMKFPIVLVDVQEFITIDGALINCETADGNITIKIAPEGLIKVEKEDTEKKIRRIDAYKCDFREYEIIKLFTSEYVSEIISMKSKLFEIGGYHLEIERNKEQIKYICNIVPNRRYLVPKLKVERRDFEREVIKFFEKDEVTFDEVKLKFKQLINEKIDGVSMIQLFQTDLDGIEKFEIIEI